MGSAMKRNLARSIIFDLLFYTSTLGACVVLLPTLILPRPAFMWVVHLWLWMTYGLEKNILGLDYDIRGLENLPQQGSYIVAAKHQSSYETMKLHALFGDPAIILKRELLWIPLWGWYLKKSDVIAIDRSSPEAARQSMAQGAARVQAQGRPIIIFPQGTRVHTTSTTAEKPYKSGLCRIQDATGLPIIPMALNSGMFWPRSGFLKSPGRVVFKFLEPIPPGYNKETIMQMLETKIEEETRQLMDEALLKNQKSAAGKSGLLNGVLWLAALALLFGGYCYAWVETARLIEREYAAFSNSLDSDMTRTYSPPVISGFPGKIRLSIEEERITGPAGSIQARQIHAAGWPIPGLPITLKTGPLEIHNEQWSAPLHFDSLEASVYYWPDYLGISSGVLKFETFVAGLSGDLDLSQKPIPKLDLVLTLQNHAPFMAELINRKVIKAKAGMIASAAIAAMSENGVARIPIVQKENDIYIGPLRVMRLSSGSPAQVLASPETSSPAPEILPDPVP
jgi:1-acyl-sn-glycerol-3-phosphate acyltransferase